MTLDTSSLPVSGNFLMSLLLYAGVSVMAGQGIAARMIDKSDWVALCETAIKDQARTFTRAAPPPKKRTDCDARFGRLHRDVQQLCWLFGNPDLELPAEKAERLWEERQRKTENARLRRMANAATSTCGCAAAQYARDNLVPLAVHAGTLRFYTPAAVAHQAGALEEAKDAQPCARIGG